MSLRIQRKPSDPRRLAELYLDIKEQLLADGFAPEIDWQNDVSFSGCTESDFLQEAAWVVLSSGMRESVIRAKFPAISHCFLNWRSATMISNKRKSCRSKALRLFGHERKIDAIITISAHVSSVGFAYVKNQILKTGISWLLRYPFLGPTTSFHLAKNLGLDVVKPDRHLVRWAKWLGFDQPVELCDSIATIVGEKHSVIDLVLWRSAVSGMLPSNLN
jgi:hypothetical protein